MHPEILTQSQESLLSLLKLFSTKFGLVGETAIALHLGHRTSIDFDLFCNTDLDINHIRNTIRKNYTIQDILVDSATEQTLIVNQVKLTFAQYPFSLDFTDDFQGYAKLPNLITLAAMKAYALGRRSKWKDYVDLYFIFQNISFAQVIDYTQNMYRAEFNQKLFREQLAYFKDIDYSEIINYLAGSQVSDDSTQQFLVDISLAR